MKSDEETEKKCRDAVIDWTDKIQKAQHAVTEMRMICAEKENKLAQLRNDFTWFMHNEVRVSHKQLDS